MRKFALIFVFFAGALALGPSLWHAAITPVRAETLETNSARAKYALLVGIGKYNRGSKQADFDWWDLNVKGDLEILADVLIRKFDFKPENIKVLSDEPVTVDGKVIAPTKPTQKAIKDAFRASITDRAKDGDIVYFHFSGHGQAIPDNNNDEADGMDETLIPSDYVSQTDGAGNLRDDDIGTMLDELSKKNPSNVTITLDSCFSGTATRGENLSRGGPWKGPPPAKKFAGKVDDSIGDFVTRGPGTRGGTTGEQKYTFISAASPRQTAKETEEGGVRYGLFSYAFVRALDTAGKSTTYRDLFEGVTSVITKDQQDQTPQIEGNQLDKLIMEDGAIPPQKFVPVQVRGGNVYLRAGRLQGMTKGSTFALYPAAAKEHKAGSEIAIVTIENVNPMTSSVKVEGTPDEEKLKGAVRAFETEHRYDEVLRVAIADPASAGKFKAVFEPMGLSEEIPASSDLWNVLIRSPDKVGQDVRDNLIPAGFRGVLLQRRDGSIISTVADADNMTAQIKTALEGEATWQLVKSFDENTNPELDVIELSMVPVSADVDEATGETLGFNDTKTTLTDRGGKTELRACIRDTTTKRCLPNTGDHVRLEIKNTSDRDVYVTILNLRSDGKIGPAFPTSNRDNRIKAGTTFKVPGAFRITEPYGQESFRAIVTETPADFTPLIDEQLRTRGPESERGKNAAGSPLGRMLQRASAGKRGDPVAPPASWATDTITFFIVPTVKN